MTLIQGALVRHDTFGLGKVVRVDQKFAHVFFVDLPGNEARKFPVNNTSLVVTTIATHPWLDNLPPFDEVGGRLRLSDKRITQSQALEKFRRLFPGGFEDLNYLGNEKIGERNYKWRKHAEYVELLGKGEGERLVEGGDVDELVRRTRRITATNMTSIFEKGAFGDALDGGKESLDYFRALFALLAAPPEAATFQRYILAIEALPQKKGCVATWPIVTLLPFLAQPDRHMFLKPEGTHEAEERLGFYLAYDAHPNWRTYSKLLELAALLMEQLRPMGAKDNIDVQSFIWVASKYDDATTA